MIEDRDGTVAFMRSLSLSLGRFDRFRRKFGSENENVRRIRSVLNRISNLSFLEVYTYTPNVVYTSGWLECLERVLSPSEKCPRRQEGGNSNRVENTANYRPIEQHTRTSSPPSFLLRFFSVQVATSPDYFHNGTTRLSKISLNR